MGTSGQGSPEEASRGPSALAVALGLDLLAVALFVAFVLVVQLGGPQDTRGQGFFSDPVSAALLLLAATAAVAAGVLAAVSLVRSPLRTRAGRWASRLALVNALLLPVVGGSVAAIAWIIGSELSEGWGEPIVPVWLLTGLGAIAMGIRAKDQGRRGLLTLPFVIGAAVLIFWLGEILSPH